MLEADAVISYELPIDIHRNYAFKPIIYGVEQYQVGDYPIFYNIELNDKIPYIIESSVSAEKDGTVYKVESSKDFSFVFSSSEKPIDNRTQNEPNGNRTVLIICISVGCVGVILFAIFIVFAICRRRTK